MRDFVKCNATAKCTRKPWAAGKCEQHYRISPDNGYLDSAPVKAHINLLMDAGWSPQGIADAAGLAARQSVLYVLRHHRVHVATAKKILAIRLDSVPRAGVVDGIGVRRRVRALAAIGWTRRLIAEEAGLTSDQLNQVMDREGPVLGSTAAAIRGVYERLCMTPGQSNLVRLRAARYGWAPPLAWDDDIDDPTAVPDFGRTVETREIVVDLRADGLSDARIAEVLNLKVDSVQQAARRYERKLAS
ncbi:hypothetical protein OS122_02725 [Mycolicibacterium mucogenicum]|uniref:hypothetical protein n=1 Tax=Mycolicibacterium mucogenicum TaxID=56689 RepID=UPI002269A801|nr:hypothetical protein [Mycolicibacterium mucogenicum]MCX8559813.1 hypothetical protein [Mycolicibacterium mucogenicum]